MKFRCITSGARDPRGRAVVMLSCAAFVVLAAGSVVLNDRITRERIGSVRAALDTARFRGATIELTYTDECWGIQRETFRGKAGSFSGTACAGPRGPVLLHPGIESPRLVTAQR